MNWLNGGMPLDAILYIQPIYFQKWTEIYPKKAKKKNPADVGCGLVYSPLSLQGVYGDCETHSAIQ